MRRFWHPLLAGLLLLGGCKIERTPIRYIDRLETPEQEVQASTEELTDRLLSTAPSLGRRNLGDVLAALAPHADISAVGPDSEVILGDASAFALALGEVASGRQVSLSDLTVQVGPENNVAWFQAVYVLPEGDDGATTRVPFTGVFVRQEGEWRLRQGHLSAPVTAEASDSTEVSLDAAEAAG